MYQNTKEGIPLNYTKTKEIKKFFRRLKRQLPYVFRTRKIFLDSLKNGITNYCQEHPDTSMDEIYGQFGTIDELAEIYIENIPKDTLSKFIIFNKLIRYACILVTITFAAWCIQFVYSVRKSAVTEIEIQTIVYPEVLDENTRKE
ncbi:DUF6120 family protein [Lachnospiraceae bacterium JLR.KK009]